jgi:hypothetical protein
MIAARERAMSVGQVIFWWEIRRILFNLALLVIGVASIAGMEVMMDQVIPVGEDAIEPLALIFGVLAYAVMANVGYTLGWIVELLMRQKDPLKAREQARRFFKLGFAGSCLLTTLPFWLGCLQWLVSRARP